MQPATGQWMASVRPFIYFSQITENISAHPRITDLSGVLVTPNYNVEELFGYGFNEKHGNGIDHI